MLSVIHLPPLCIYFSLDPSLKSCLCLSMCKYHKYLQFSNCISVLLVGSFIYKRIKIVLNDCNSSSLNLQSYIHRCIENQFGSISFQPSFCVVVYYKSHLPLENY